jgi:hypothetical protein
LYKKFSHGERTWAVRKPGGFLKVIPTVGKISSGRERSGEERRGMANF